MTQLPLCNATETLNYLKQFKGTLSCITERADAIGEFQTYYHNNRPILQMDRRTCTGVWVVTGLVDYPPCKNGKKLVIDLG